MSSNEEPHVTLTELEHCSVILGLVEHVSSTSEPLQVKFALKLEPSIFSNLLKMVLTLDSHHPAAVQDLRHEDTLTTECTWNSDHDSMSARLVCSLKLLTCEFGVQLTLTCMLNQNILNHYI